MMNSPETQKYFTKKENIFKFYKITKSDLKIQFNIDNLSLQNQNLIVVCALIILKITSLNLIRISALIELYF